ncbi:DUF3558 domain-containing protein [Actinokineospora guangxiensis]|uniref:DUF3558 domain-containing protein n=1 Tax=Actinokineospora guangxiensis TaxID=1490288 RepID=A0ABW0EHQ7_9PSEU
MRHVGAFALLTVVLAACGSPETSGDGPTPSAQPPSLAPTDFQAPAVTTPLDTARLQKAPCDSLTPEHLSSLGAADGAEQRNQGGLTCRWTYGGDGAVTVLWSAEAGLDAVYQTRQLSAYFEPLPELDGYPAVTSERHDNRPTGACSIHVGTAETTMFTVSVQQPRTQVDTPCSTATAAASVVLATAENG